MVAAVAFVHKAHNLFSPSEEPGFQPILKGIKRRLFKRPKRANPLTPDIVRRAFSVLGDDLECDSYYDVSLRTWRTVAHIVLSFSALLRYDDMSKLSINNVTFVNGRAQIFIPTSKTDQFGEGQLVSIGSTSSQHCPVNFLRCYIRRLFWEAAVEGKTYEGPLFPGLSRRTVSGPLGTGTSALPASPTPFSYTGALGDFRALLKAIGITNPSSFSLHSGRRGGATEAARRGCDFMTLKRQGRWRSYSCPQLYEDDVINNSNKFVSYLGL